MVIGIEASRANRLKKTGVEWYAYHLIQALKLLPETLAHSWLLYSDTPLSMGLEKSGSNWHDRLLAWPPKYVWTQLRLSLEMLRQKPETLFVPVHVLPRFIPNRTVITLHDVAFRRYPTLYGKREAAYHDWSTRDSLHRAARIITVSEFSKRELIELYKAREDKIFVTPLAIDHALFQRMDVATATAFVRRFQVGIPFFLYIGRVEAKKNVRTLVEAFGRFKAWRGLGDPTKLVLVGKPGVGYDTIKKAIEASPVCEDICLVGYVSEEEKAAFLSLAIALVHPAWYEGFGTTPLEAMACGCPTIVARTSSLPEVVGLENALWFSPTDPLALAECMSDLVDHSEIREVLRVRGLDWTKKYTWEETARQTLPILTEW